MAGRAGGALSAHAEVSPNDLGWRNHYRLILSQLPTISLFEDYVDADLLEAAFAIEARTNPRLRAQAGDLTLVAKQDYVLGPGASPVMAAFTHVGRASRFTDGSFGVYYAANKIDTALEEVKFHRARFLAATNEPATSLTLRSYVGAVKKSLIDIRDAKYKQYANPSLQTYPRCQRFSEKLRNNNAWGLLYPSVRHAGGQCVAFYRPPALGIPKQGKHFELHWDGQTINKVFELKEWKAKS